MHRTVVRDAWSLRTERKCRKFSEFQHIVEATHGYMMAMGLNFTGRLLLFLLFDSHSSFRAL